MVHSLACRTPKAGIPPTSRGVSHSYQGAYASRARPAGLRSIGGLSIALTVLLWTGVGLSVLALIDALASLVWLQGKDPDGDDFWFEQPATWALLSGVLAIVTFAVLLATVVVWCVWQNFATKNVLAWGGVPRRGSGWAVGAWFVPIINLWWPAQNVHDLLRLSTPGLGPGSMPGRQLSEPVIGWWWGLWLASNFASQASGRLFFDAYDNSERTAAYASDLVAQPLGAASAVLAIAVVARVASRQRDSLIGPAARPPELGLNL